MPEFRVIVVPYELGRLRHGVGRGPERLLSGGAVEALASAGADVRVDVVEFDESFERTGYGEVDASFDLIRVVAERVRDAVADGAFPVLLSGSCFNGVGVVAGLRRAAPGCRLAGRALGLQQPRHGDLRLLRRHGAGRARPVEHGPRCTPRCRAGGRYPRPRGARRRPRLRAAGAGAPRRIRPAPGRRGGHGDARRAAGRDPVAGAPADRHLPAPRPRRAQRGRRGRSTSSAHPAGPTAISSPS